MKKSKIFKKAVFFSSIVVGTGICLASIALPALVPILIPIGSTMIAGGFAMLEGSLNRNSSSSSSSSESSSNEHSHSHDVVHIDHSNIIVISDNARCRPTPSMLLGFDEKRRQANGNGDNTLINHLPAKNRSTI